MRGACEVSTAEIVNSLLARCQQGLAPGHDTDVLNECPLVSSAEPLSGKGLSLLAHEGPSHPWDLPLANRKLGKAYEARVGTSLRRDFIPAIADSES